MYLPTDRPLAARTRGMGAAIYTPAELQAMITATAQQYGVDPAVALAIAKTESNFNPSAVGATNPNGTTDYGLMQINSANLSSLGLTTSSALDPQQNINAAMQLLAKYTQTYGGDPSLIAAAYNGGPGAVSSGNIPQSYVSTVLGNMSSFPSSAGSSLQDLVDNVTGADDSSAAADAGAFDPSWLLYGGLGLAAAIILAKIA